MITKIDHIGIAVKATEESLRFWREGLGLQIGGSEVVEKQKVTATFLPIGATNIELLEPSIPDSPVGKFIESKGPGIHHVCFQVDDVAKTLEFLKSMGVSLINETPVPGAHGKLVAFVHPKSTGGVLVELSQIP